MSKNQAMDAVAAAREVHEEAWRKLGKIVAKKRLRGLDPKKEVRIRTRTGQRISHYNTLLLELEASSEVIQPPSVEDVQRMRDLIVRVRDIAVEDALRSEGLQLISDALAQSSAIVSKVKPASGLG